MNRGQGTYDDAGFRAWLYRRLRWLWDTQLPAYAPGSFRVVENKSGYRLTQSGDRRIIERVTPYVSGSPRFVENKSGHRLTESGDRRIIQ